jgi:GT2 family glycosyltransferase
LNEQLHIGFVTYGNRIQLILPTIIEYLEKTKAVIIVVCNGVDSNVLDILVQLQFNYPERLLLSNTKSNLGSAGGFATLFKTAKKINPTTLLVLDDDCYITIENLYKLNTILEKSNNQVFSCFREGREYMKRIKDGLDFSNTIARKNSFMGFDLIRYFKRYIEKEKTVLYTNPKIPFAPYSGLVLKNKALKNCNLPRKEFYLYADDTEFTFNLAKDFGIILLTDIEILEREKSWNVEKNTSAASRIWDGKENFRVYFSTRNQVYLDLNLFSDNKIYFFFNVCFFTFITFSIGLIKLVTNRISIKFFFMRLYLYFKAIKNGLFGIFKNEI